MLTNGDHNTESTADYGVPDIRNDRKAWLDQWVRGVNGGFGSLRQARSSVSVLFETHKENQVDEETQAEKEVLVPNGRKDAKTFPLPDTNWTDWYLHGDGSLTTTAPTAAEPSQPYVTGTKRQFWSYQAGGDVGPPLTTAAGLGRAVVPQRSRSDPHRRGADHGDAVRAEHRSRHRVVRPSSSTRRRTGAARICSGGAAS
jgi:predicted acyl esterase